MVTDLAASPMRAITSAPPARVLRAAIVIGAVGLIALVAAVGVLVWTYTGVKEPSQQTVPSDITSAREVLVPKTAAPAVAPPAPAPPPAPATAAALPPGLGSLTAPGGTATTPNPASAIFAPTAPRPVSAPAPSVDLPTIKWPTTDAWVNDIANNVNWPALFWGSPSGGATSGAIVGAITSTANNALNLVGNSAIDVFNTLLLINSGYYDGRGGTGLLGTPADVLSTLAKIDLPPPPSFDLTKLPSPQGLPQLPPPPNFDLTKLPPPPNFDPRKLPPPPNLELPKPPKLPSITKMIGLPF